MKESDYPTPRRLVERHYSLSFTAETKLNKKLLTNRLNIKTRGKTKQ